MLFERGSREAMSLGSRVCPSRDVSDDGPSFGIDGSSSRSGLCLVGRCVVLVGWCVLPLFVRGLLRRRELPGGCKVFYIGGIQSCVDLTIQLINHSLRFAICQPDGQHKVER